jgi:hypothetical protein
MIAIARERLRQASLNERADLHLGDAACNETAIRRPDSQNQNLLLTHFPHWHKIAPNMLKSTRWFAFYFYYGFHKTAAVGGA